MCVCVGALCFVCCVLCMCVDLCALRLLFVMLCLQCFADVDAASEFAMLAAFDVSVVCVC